MFGSNAAAVLVTFLAFGYVTMFVLAAAGWLVPPRDEER
jgi:hypothetical protein